MVMEQLDVYMQKKNLGIGHTILKNITQNESDINLKFKIIKLLEDNMEGNTDDLGFGNDFLGITPKAWAMKERIDKQNFIKIKIFYSRKSTIKRMKK